MQPHMTVCRNSQITKCRPYSFSVAKTLKAFNKMIKDPQHNQYLKYVEKNESDPLTKESFIILLEEIEKLSQESKDFFPGFSNIVKAETLKVLHQRHKEKTRNQVVCVDGCWKMYTNFQKMRNFRAL